MGYTRYWTFKKDPTEEMWNKFFEQANAIINFSKGIVVNEGSDRVVSFNGKEPNDCEDFFVDSN